MPAISHVGVFGNRSSASMFDPSTANLALVDFPRCSLEIYRSFSFAATAYGVYVTQPTGKNESSVSNGYIDNVIKVVTAIMGFLSLQHHISDLQHRKRMNDSMSTLT
ncbi:hypothetical protein TrVFT333_000799 [Trichoderma virens FT-333]|nr:hypothetical protein TrVFT333_000799 [Trichoderma virens FT-333]